MYVKNENACIDQRKNNDLNVLEENHMCNAITISFHWYRQIDPEETNWIVMQGISLELIGKNNKIILNFITTNNTYAVTRVVISGYVVNVTIH